VGDQSLIRVHRRATAHLALLKRGPARSKSMRSRWCTQLAAVVILAVHPVEADRLHDPHAATTGAYVQPGELADARAAWQRRLLFSERDHTDLYTVRTERRRSLQCPPASRERHRPRSSVWGSTLGALVLLCTKLCG
jgi:hypothetical protein